MEENIKKYLTKEELKKGRELVYILKSMNRAMNEQWRDAKLAEEINRLEQSADDELNMLEKMAEEINRPEQEMGTDKKRLISWV